MRIRRAQPKDAKSIMNILKNTSELSSMGGGFQDPLYTPEFVDEYIRDKKMSLVLVAEDAGKLFGFVLAEIWTKKGFGYLADIVVLKEARGKGVGRKLYGAFEKHCKKKSIKAIAMIVQTDNDGMCEFCGKMGFDKGGNFYCFEKQI